MIDARILGHMFQEQLIQWVIQATPKCINMKKHNSPAA